MPKFQKAVDAGEAYAFLNTSRQFPHGSSLAATEVRFAFGRTLKSVATGVTNDVGMPPGLFTTAMGELWTMLYAQQLPKFFDAKYYRVLFLKTLPGKTSADIVNIYKAPATAPPTTNPYLIFSRSFRGPDDDFNVIVIHGNDELDQVSVGGVTPLTPASQLGLERFRDVRTVVRSELWSRRPEYVVPKK